MTQGCAWGGGDSWCNRVPHPVGCCFGTCYVFPAKLPQNGSLVAGGSEHPTPGLGGYWDLQLQSFSPRQEKKK